MRYDHICLFNERMEAARMNAEQTLAAMRHQQQELQSLVTMTQEVIQAMGSQIEQVDRLRVVFEQISVERPAAEETTGSKLSLALRSVDRREKASGEHA